MELEHFSLRWNNFHSNLSSGFQTLLQEEDLVDVTLAAGGEFVQAHKIVLSVCSPYFKQLFKVNPCKHPIVILKDVCHKDLVDILQFMYRGEVNVRQEDLSAFLKTAELLQVKGLTGQDSPSSKEQPQEHTQPSERLTPTPAQPRIRNPRRRVEKAQTQSASPMPPFKRVRSEAPASVSPVVLNEDSSTSGVEYVEMPCPKQEPIDFDSAAEPQSMGEESRVSESLEQLLAGESSHSMHGLGSDQALDSTQQMGPAMDSKISMGLPPEQGSGAPMAGVPGGSADATMTQDGEQGLRYVVSARGKPQLVLDDHLYCLNAQDGPRKYWICARYFTQGCRSRVTTLNNCVVNKRGEHNHERELEKIREKEQWMLLRQKAQEQLKEETKSQHSVHKMLQEVSLHGK